MKKKKIALLLVLVLGAFSMCGYFISHHIERRVREKLAMLPMLSMTVKDIEYSILSDTLRLSGCRFEYALKNKASDVIVMSAKDIAIYGVNSAIEAIEDGLPTVFEKMQIDTLFIAFKTAGGTIFTHNVDTYTVFDYAHNVHKTLKAYQEKPFSEDFFRALLHFRHGGIEKQGALFVFNNEKGIQERTLYTKRAYLYPMQAGQPLSLLYEGIVYKAASGTLESDTMRIHDVQLPSPQVCSAFAVKFQKELINSPTSLWVQALEKFGI